MFYSWLCCVISFCMVLFNSAILQCQLQVWAIYQVCWTCSVRRNFLINLNWWKNFKAVTPLSLSGICTTNSKTSSRWDLCPKSWTCCPTWASTWHQVIVITLHLNCIYWYLRLGDIWFSSFAQRFPIDSLWLQFDQNNNDIICLFAFIIANILVFNVWY